jgi:branched-chain amino acid transport system ATP-binding protein
MTERQAAKLEVRDLWVRYGQVTALRGVSLSATPGITAVVGANGAGKSTLLKTVSGLLTPSQGSIEVGGQRIDGARPLRIVRSGVVQVPEGRQLFPDMTVLETLEIGGLGLGRERRAERFDYVFELFPRLGERRSQRAATLSGGEQQMVAIARALIPEPRVLLMDEPSLGLAPVLTERVAETVELLGDSGMTILLVEQNARMALRLARYAYVLVNGTVGLEGSADELLDDPSMVERYLGTRREA